MKDNIFQVQLLMESGGIIMWLILLVSIVMWSLIAERYIYLKFQLPRDSQKLIDYWHARSERNSWYAQQIRNGLIADGKSKLERNLVLIQTLVVILPMLGLLGTVMGMIQTFEVMAAYGTGNTRGMAGGISVALITTMGGLMTALSGMYFSTELKHKVDRTVNNIADALRRE